MPLALLLLLLLPAAFPLGREDLLLPATPALQGIDLVLVPRTAVIPGIRVGELADVGSNLKGPFKSIEHLISLN